MESRIVTLESLNSGAVQELFDEEWGKLLHNVADDNTDAEKVRSITIKVTVKPSKLRDKADTKVSVTSTLAPLKPHESYIVLSTDGQTPQAFVTAPSKQQELPNVSTFAKAAGGQ